MKYDEILTEGRDAPLYHGTALSSALTIVLMNEIQAKSSHDTRKLLMNPSKDEVFGVSLSRNRNISFAFGTIVFELDQKTLVRTNRLIPIDFWSTQYPVSLRGNRHASTVDQYEFEEFCIGSIKPLDKYLISITVKKEKFDRFKIFYSEKTLESYQLLFNHPLFKIEDK